MRRISPADDHHLASWARVTPCNLDRIPSPMVRSMSCDTGHAYCVEAVRNCHGGCTIELCSQHTTPAHGRHHTRPDLPCSVCHTSPDACTGARRIVCQLESQGQHVVHTDESILIVALVNLMTFLIFFLGAVAYARMPASRLILAPQLKALAIMTDLFKL